MKSTDAEILRVLSEARSALSSREIAKEIEKRGLSIKGRTIRYHLMGLEKQGLISKIGGHKRAITSLGHRELERVLIYERLGSLMDRGAELMSKATFNLKSGVGTVPANLALVPASHSKRVLNVLKEVSTLNLFPSSLIKIVNEEEIIGDFTVPKGMMGIACISSCIFDAVLLREGVLVMPTYAGLFEFRDNKPLGFVELIMYEGTTISPSLLFIKAGFTSVLNVARTGGGKVNAAIREAPASTIDKVEEVLNDLQSYGIGGTLGIYKPGQVMYGVPLRGKKIGIITMGGANLLAPLFETGLASQLHVVATLIDFSAFRKLHP